VDNPYQSPAFCHGLEDFRFLERDAHGCFDDLSPIEAALVKESRVITDGWYKGIEQTYAHRLHVQWLQQRNYRLVIGRVCEAAGTRVPDALKSLEESYRGDDATE
jgi:hypothetical protein